jgi:hypothetical protein
LFESSFPQNNNPNVFTKDARPIVDFSIENRKVLNAREKRQIKSVEKNPIANKGNKNPRAAIAAVKTAVKPLKVPYIFLKFVFWQLWPVGCPGCTVFGCLW